MTATDYDPASKEAAMDLCYQLAGNHDRWGEVNGLACDAYHAGLLAGRAECRQKMARLEAELARIKAELDTVCDAPTVIRPIMVEPAPAPDDDPPLPQTEHLGIVSPDASGCVEGEGFICHLTPKVVKAIDESVENDVIEWKAIDGLTWVAEADSLRVIFSSTWETGARSFEVKRDDLPR